MSWRSGWPPAGAGWLVLSGFLLGLAFPPFHLLVPSFVALVPLGVWIAGLPPGREGRARAWRGGFFLGLIYYTLVFYWLLVALIFYTPLAVPAFLVPVLIMCTLLALAVLGAHLCVTRLRWPIWLVLPVFWTADEWARAHLGDISFPWMQLGDSLSSYPWLIGAADLVGGRGLSFWLALVNGVLAYGFVAVRRREADEARRRETRTTEAPETGRAAAARRVRGGLRSARGPAVGLLAALSIPIGYSAYRWNTLRMRPAATVAVIQPNIPEDLKLAAKAATDSAVRATEFLVRERILYRSVAARDAAGNGLATAGGSDGGGPSEEATAADSSGIDLLLLPETALVAYMDPIPSYGHRGRPDLAAWVAGLARRLDAEVLYGALGSKDLGGGAFDYYNSAFLADREGRRVGRYDKHYLVPVVERVPFLDPRWFRKLTYFGGFGVGGEPVVFPAGDAEFGVLICYESIYSSLGRYYRNRGADFLVNITNDAWFGRRGAWWSRSSALWQHPAHLVVRAIETRMGIARSANTGISEIVDPLGRVHHRTSLFTADAFVGDVWTTDGRTFYARYGDVAGWTCLLLSLAAVGLALGGFKPRRPPVC
ncbi:MAG: apolipoprotein N-acyltransferase [Gemmatimonadota bacterium]